ncbi:MAG: FKBP-type peptidyl-prolyl cis-trans isomerase [Blastocatellia bacterium]
MARKANTRTPNTQKSKPRSAAKGSARNIYITVAIAVVLVATIGLYLFLGRGSGGASGGGSEVTTPSGLKYVDEVVGNGPSPAKGQRVTVNYRGTLENGSQFDSSYDRHQPFSFTIGTGGVIKGWDEGVMTMKVGGKRKLTIPSDLGYGVNGMPPKIPPNANLIFEVELLSVQ